MSELQAVADEILRLLGESAEERRVSLPARQYWTIGGAVYDDAQVVLSVNSVQTGVVGQIQEAQVIGHGCPAIWNATIEVAIVRAMNQANQGRRGTLAPNPETIAADAEVNGQDWEVLRAMTDAMVTHEYLQGFTASLALGETQGGLSASVLTLNVNLFL